MDAEQLRRRNAELERQLNESRAREEAMRAELERALRKLHVAEEAEERLCSEIGELEAESAVQARQYFHQIQALSDQLRQVSATAPRARAGGLLVR